MNRSPDQQHEDEKVAPLGDLAARTFEKQMRMLRFAEMCERKEDLSLLIECLYTEASAMLSFDGLSYVAPDDAETIQLGRLRQIRKRFELSLGGEALGYLFVHSPSALQPREIRTLQDLFPGFVYALRNALAKRREIMASWVDEFTGMNNQVALNELLPREMALSRESEEPLSLLTIDLDHFTQVNENHGREVGDQMIVTVAETLTANLRSTDVIFRTDDGQFVVILGASDFDDASLVSERLRTCVDRCFSYQNVQVVQNASAGVTEMVDQDTAESLLARSYMALKTAKQAGRNRVRFLAASEEA